MTDLLAIYLYNNKYLSLPKLGRFDVSEDADLSQPEMVEFNRIPKDVISFTPNISEETDTELVRYITKHTRKMQSLAVADLFTLTDQARQMLNIFQPVSIAGIGTLNKSIKGQIEFTPGGYLPQLLKKYNEGTYLPDYSEKPSSSVLRNESATSTSPVASSSRSLGGVLIIAICLAVAGVLIYFMFSHGGNDDKYKDITTADTSSATDSIKKEEKKEAIQPNHTGIIHYEVVFEHGVDSFRAFHRYDQLTGWGHDVIMRTSDSVHFTLAIPFTTPASDTTHVKDSIRILYGKPTTIRYRTGR